MLDEVRFLATPGNHDRTNDRKYGNPNYDAVLGLPHFYTVQFDEACLIVVDSNVLVDQYQDIEDDLQDELFRQWFVSDEGSDRPSWLERELEACGKPFVMVAMHHPLLTFAKHQGDWRNPRFGRNLDEKRRRLLELLAQGGVQLVFSGHDHLYQHNLYRDKDGREIHFLVAGGGGARLRDVPSGDEIASVEEEFLKHGSEAVPLAATKAYHYSLVDMGEEGVTVRVMEVTGQDGQPVRVLDTVRVEQGFVD